ncbi:MAG: AAA family ATPase [Bacteriovoracaceae bacterium]|nr:AAA family ATPase [Bacteriovoracaceae bacterium]
MSNTSARDWLLSQNSYSSSTSKKATTISITSGKGGVGKTSVAIKLSIMLAKQGKKTLLLDCDYNMSNTHVKLDLPPSNSFYSLVTAQKSFDECVYKDGLFHLLSGCNGNVELFENGVELDKLVIDIIQEHEHEYDYILLDCPAGITKSTLTLNAYSDHRYIIVAPDKASITDSYALMKILRNKYGTNENSLIVNKVSSKRQYTKIVKVLSETVETYLQSRLHILGGIAKSEAAVDRFDRILLNDENTMIHQNFNKVINKMTEEIVVPSGFALENLKGQYIPVNDLEQEVHKNH